MRPESAVITSSCKAPCHSATCDFWRATGFFDFTFDRTEGEEHRVLREDFYYRTAARISLAEAHGRTAQFMDDGEQRPHCQSKIRISHPAAAWGQARAAVPAPGGGPHRQRSRQGRLASNAQPGTRYCIAAASSRAPSASFR
jgi:hypothetical protein